MTPFECEFINKCLTKLSSILADEQELSRVVTAFSQNDDKNPRYELRSKIPNALYWSHHELRQFSAAYAETIFQVVAIYKDNLAISNEQIHAAKTLLEERYILKITKETPIGKRIASVIEQIAAGFEFDQKEPASSSATDKINRHGFFFSAGIIATASVAAAIYLSSSQ